MNENTLTPGEMFCLLSLSISLINVYIYSTSVHGKNHAIGKYETVQLDLVSQYLDVFEMGYHRAH